MTTTRRSPAPNLAPNLARAILVAVFVLYALVAFLRMVYQGYGPPSRIVLSVAYLIPMLWLQLYVFGRPGIPFRRPVLYTALLCQAVLVYAAVAYTPAWLSLIGFLAGSALVVLPPRMAWPVFALVVASMAVNYARLSSNPLEITFAAGTTCSTGLVVY